LCRFPSKDHQSKRIKEEFLPLSPVVLVLDELRVEELQYPQWQDLPALLGQFEALVALLLVK